MASLPRPATAPKLASLQVELHPVAVLDESSFGDDELVTELSAAELQLAGLACEFVELAGVQVSRGTLAGSRWRRTNWVDVALAQVDGANAHFDESGWHRTAWTGSRLTGLGLAGCTAQDVTFTECKLDLANFRFANLKRTTFVGCDLTGADFANAMLHEVIFDHCTLDEAAFHHARVDRVLIDGGSLSGVKGLDGLRGAQIRADQIYDLAREMAAALGLQLVVD